MDKGNGNGINVNRAKENSPHRAYVTEEIVAKALENLDGDEAIKVKGKPIIY